MFGIGMPELLVILLIVFLLFGSKKLPEIGSGLGKAISSFKQGLGGIEATGKELTQSVPGLKEISEIKKNIEQVKDSVSLPAKK